MLAQLAANVVISSGIYVMVALSFTVSHRVHRFFNFALGALFTLAAYFLYVLRICCECSLVLSILIAIPLGCLVGVLVELVIYSVLRSRRGSSAVLLLASLGVYVLLQNLISALFGDATVSLGHTSASHEIGWSQARITSVQAVTVVSSVVVAACLDVFLTRTRSGRSLRAVASDPELSVVCGISSRSVMLRAAGISAGIAALAGVLFALDLGLTPTMGMSPLMMGIVVAIIGGANRISGIVLGALLLASAQQYGVCFINSQWQDAIAFILLLLFLAFRPQGFLGSKGKKAFV